MNKHIHHTRIDSSSFVAEQNFPLHLEFPPLLISLIHESSARRFIASRSRIVVPSCSFFPVDRNYRELPLSLNIQFFAIEFSSRRGGWNQGGEECSSEKIQSIEKRETRSPSVSSIIIESVHARSRRNGKSMLVPRSKLVNQIERFEPDDLTDLSNKYLTAGSKMAYVRT